MIYQKKIRAPKHQFGKNYVHPKYICPNLLSVNYLFAEVIFAEIFLPKARVTHLTCRKVIIKQKLIFYHGYIQLQYSGKLVYNLMAY